MRTLEQLRARIEHAKKVDVLGVALDDLRIYDPTCYKEGVPDSEKHSLANAAVEAEAALKDYFPFAFEKAAGHRGLSADRSINHIINWLWLMERDDLLSFAEDDRNYKNYGVPILKKVALAMGHPLPPEIEKWEDGKRCKPDCASGCG